ncbi:Uncharacterized [Moorella glycerini]|uniref:Uncharacterized protein n=1 Tax=Neomoorella stamsii TaxID=1266720 RepID=A0A9X7J5G9_9FIRM|nr:MULTISPECIES: hypothetical protein [Moorella]PRR74609.1 hypothetical protein MOST_10440 [Moorella stamsii]CEP69104.1 Uncharacterized [Moorella glycerini]
MKRYRQDSPVVVRVTGTPAIEESLEQYLIRKKGTGDGGSSSVKTTRGSIPARPEVVKKVLAEEDFFKA